MVITIESKITAMNQPLVLLFVVLSFLCLCCAVEVQSKPFPKIHGGAYTQVSTFCPDIKALVFFLTHQYNKDHKNTHFHVPHKISYAGKGQTPGSYHVDISFAQTNCLNPPRRDLLCIAEENGVRKNLSIFVVVGKKDNKVQSVMYAEMK